LPSGRVTQTQAVIFLGIQLLIGLVILLQFNRPTILLGLLSLVTIVIYPFMKRITWWPQLFLGLAFSWGALMGWPALRGDLEGAPIILYLGCIFWVIGYDTIYAHQDIEDDALVGVKSTARLFGDRTREALVALYGTALALFVFAWYAAGISWIGWLGLIAGGAQMVWQIATLDIHDPARCLKLFKSNSHFGWILFVGLAVAAFAG
jgi:4-hydroxybenzoate polyprenyltransferase